MKRVFVLLVLFLSLGSMTLFAQDHNVSIGGGVYVANYLDGGFSEFEFMILKNESFDIRNHLIFRWVGLSDNLGEVMSLSEKISFGGFVENNFRSYAFIEGGIGIWENDNKDIFAMPFAYTVGGGGGTDIYLLDDFSICLEAGLLMHLLDGEWKGGGLFQISWRAYF